MEEQIIGFLREAETGLPVADSGRWLGFSEASSYLWPHKFGGRFASEPKRPKELELENARLRRLRAESMHENEVTKEALKKTSTLALPPGEARWRQCPG